MQTIEQKISAMMSKASRARSAESRSRGGRVAWQTRVENLRAKLGRLEARKDKP